MYIENLFFLFFCVYIDNIYLEFFVRFLLEFSKKFLFFFWFYIIDFTWRKLFFIIDFLEIFQKISSFSDRIPFNSNLLLTIGYHSKSFSNYFSFSSLGVQFSVTAQCRDHT